MNNSFSNMKKLTARQNKAMGYTYKDTQSNFIGGERKEFYGVGSYLAPDGGVFSTTRDLYTYFKAINNHTLVNKEIASKKPHII